MAKKKQQTIAKRNRERAVEEKRRLKRERKQAVKAAKARRPRIIIKLSCMSTRKPSAEGRGLRIYRSKP